MHQSALYSLHTLINYPAVQLSLSRISLNHVAPTVTKSGCPFHFFFFTWVSALLFGRELPSMSLETSKCSIHCRQQWAGH